MAMKEVFQRKSPSFAYRTFDDFIRMLEGRERFERGIDSYPRDGSPELDLGERQVAELAGTDKDHILLCNSGMSAVTTAIEIASLTAGDTAVHGFQGYSQIYGYFQEDLQERGVKSCTVDSSSIESIQEIIEARHPKVIFFETITNGTEMTILDIEKFLNLQILKEVDPIIILDNTLPTDSILPLAGILQKHADLKIIGLESATKFYVSNQELGGILFAYNEEILRRLEKKRRRIGSILGLSGVKTVSREIPTSKEEFDRANRLVMSNTYRLAGACFGAQTENGKFFVSYPNLPNHPNSDYANLHFPNGSASVFFITVDPSLGNHLDLAKALCEHPVIGVKNGKTILAQSFGFSKTGIVFYRFDPYIRIAGGTESPERIEELGKWQRGVVYNFDHERRPEI